MSHPLTPFALALALGAGLWAAAAGDPPAWPAPEESLPARTPADALPAAAPPGTPAPPPAPAIETGEETEIVYEGFGKDTKGGAGGRVIEVSSLEDAGRGTLREALEAQGPRIVRIRVEGTIKVRKLLDIQSPFITVDGEGAPGQGVTVEGGIAVNFRGGGAHDVILKNLRIRRAHDGIALYNTHNVVIDRCSIGPAGDGAIDVVRNCRNVTIARCLLTDTEKANLVSYGAKDVSIHRTIYHHCASRNPQGQKKAVIDIRNNIVWNFSGYGVRFASGTRGNVVNCFFFHERIGQMDQALAESGWESGAAHLAGNEGPFGPIDPGALHNSPDPVEAPPVATLAVPEMMAKVLAEAGARPLDERDRKAIEEIRAAWEKIRAGEWPKPPEAEAKAIPVEGDLAAGVSVEGESLGLADAKVEEDEAASGGKAAVLGGNGSARALLQLEKGRYLVTAHLKAADPGHDAVTLHVGGVKKRLFPARHGEIAPSEPVSFEAPGGPVPLLLRAGDPGVAVDRLVFQRE